MSPFEGLKLLTEDAKKRLGEVVKPEETPFDDTIYKANKLVEKAQGIEDWRGISNAIESGNEEILEDYDNLSEAMALVLIDRHPEIIARHPNSFEESAHGAMIRKYREKMDGKYMNFAFYSIENYTGLNQKDLLSIIDKSKEMDSWHIEKILSYAVKGNYKEVNLQELFEKVAEKNYLDVILKLIQEVHTSGKLDKINWTEILKKLPEKNTKDKFTTWRRSVIELALGKEEADVFYDNLSGN